MEIDCWNAYRLCTEFVQQHFPEAIEDIENLIILEKLEYR